MKNKSKTLYFGELIDLAEATFSEDTHTVSVTLIKPGWSKNKRFYSPELLRKRASMFEGVKAYADHPSRAEQKDRPERSVRDIVGYYENVVADTDGSIKADLRIVGDAKNWLSPLVSESIEKNPSLIGASINALGKVSKGTIEGQQGLIVEDIVKANSVDVVTTPAAGGGFDRLLMADDSFTSDLIAAISLDELREARPDLIDALQKEWKTPRQNKALESARDKNEVLRKQLKASEQKANSRKEVAGQINDALAEVRDEIALIAWGVEVDRLLSEAKLPDKWKSNVRQSLVDLRGDTKRAKKLIADEQTKLEAVRQPVSVKGAGRSHPVANPAKSTKHPLTEVFGIQDVPRDGESPADFQKRITSHRAV